MASEAVSGWIDQLVRGESGFTEFGPGGINEIKGNP